MTKQVFITSVSGTLVAEMDNNIVWEMVDVIYDCGFGFGESFEVEVEDGDDVWSLIDKIYENYAA